jgi:hypothetical protein
VPSPTASSGWVLTSAQNSIQGMRRERFEVHWHRSAHRRTHRRYTQSGAVLVSNTVRDLVAGSGLKFEDRGLRACPSPGESRRTSSSVSLGERPGFARAGRRRGGYRFLNLSFASLTACRSAVRRSFVASASCCCRSCISVSWRLACAIHLSMCSIHVGTSSSALRNVNASSSNRTPPGVAILAESSAPRKDCRQRIDGDALRGTRHVTRSCVLGGPARLTFMRRLYASPLRRGKLTLSVMLAWWHSNAPSRPARGRLLAYFDQRRASPCLSHHDVFARNRRVLQGASVPRSP